MGTDRDTHFLNWASTLCEDERLSHFLDNPYYCSSGMRQEIVTLIAQHGYDLVAHACSQLGNAEYALRYWPDEQVIDEYIPDPTQRPNTSREAP